MLAYQRFVLAGSVAKAATSARGRRISISVCTSTATRPRYSWTILRVTQPPPQDPFAPPGPSGPPGPPGPPAVDPWYSGEQPPPPPAWGQPAWGQPAWSQPVYPYQPGPSTNTLAIVALVTAFVCFPAAVVLGIIALVQIRRTGQG